MEAVDNICVYCCGLAHLLAYFLHTLSTNRQLESSCDSLAWCSGVTRVWVLCLLSSLPPHCLLPLHSSSLHCRTFVRGRMTSIGGQISQSHVCFFWQGVVLSKNEIKESSIIEWTENSTFVLCLAVLFGLFVRNGHIKCQSAVRCNAVSLSRQIYCYLNSSHRHRRRANCLHLSRMSHASSGNLIQISSCHLAVTHLQILTIVKVFASRQPQKFSRPNM